MLDISLEIEAREIGLELVPDSLCLSYKVCGKSKKRM